MKIVIQKTVGDLGETWMVEVPLERVKADTEEQVVAQIKNRLDPALRVMDDRLLNLNLRLLNRNAMARKLAPEANEALNQVVQMMYGRRQGPVMVDQDGVIQDTSMPKIPEDQVQGNVERAAGALERALEQQ